MKLAFSMFYDSFPMSFLMPEAENRLTHGGKIVSPTHWPRFIPQKHYFFLLLVLSKRHGLVQSEGLDELKKIIHLLWFRTRYLLASSIAP
jgi:hypothetical protein